MSSPRIEMPEHEYLPVNKDGNGPAEIEETVRWMCWCELHEYCPIKPPIDVQQT